MVATVLLGLGIAAGAALLAATVSRTLQAAVDSGALQSAREVAALVDTQQLPNPVPVGGEGTASIQVVDAAGPGAGGVRRAPTGWCRCCGRPSWRPSGPATGWWSTATGSGLDGPLRVVGVPAGPAGDPLTVVVAVDYGSARSGVRLLVAGLAVGAPLLLAVVGARDLGGGRAGAAAGGDAPARRGGDHRGRRVARGCRCRPPATRCTGSR